MARIFFIYAYDPENSTKLVDFTSFLEPSTSLLECPKSHDEVNFSDPTFYTDSEISNLKLKKNCFDGSKLWLCQKWNILKSNYWC